MFPHQLLCDWFRRHLLKIIGEKGWCCILKGPRNEHNKGREHFIDCDGSNIRKYLEIRDTSAGIFVWNSVKKWLASVIFTRNQPFLFLPKK